MGAEIHGQMGISSWLHPNIRGGWQQRCADQGAPVYAQKPCYLLGFGVQFWEPFWFQKLVCLDCFAYGRVDKNSPNFRAFCFVSELRATGMQVHTSWQWHGYLRDKVVQHGLTSLRLNLDETSIELNHDDAKGVVHKHAKGKLILVKKKFRKTWFLDACCARM